MKLERVEKVEVDLPRSLAFVIFESGVTPELGAVKRSLEPYRAVSLEKLHD